ncbi:V-ATPase subunit C family protein [Brugia pahangi]
MFLISMPIENYTDAKWLKLRTVALNFSIFSNIRIPKFRTAPKAELYELLEDLLQLDNSVENLLRSLLCTFEGVLQAEGVDLLEHLVMHRRRYGENITNFSWNTTKYSPYLLLPDLCHLFYKYFRDLDQQMRSNIATYKENLKIATEYISFEETLATQNLTLLIREETVIDTPYIESVYVAVPQQSVHTWLNVYETLHDSVVSCSSCFIIEDNDYKLYSVAIVRDDFLEFRDNCAEVGFIAREYQSDEDEFARKLHEHRKLEEATQYQNIMLVQWLKMIAEDIFEVLIHIKVFRAYIGSLTQYDQDKFQIIMFYPRRNATQRLLFELRKLFEEEYMEATDQSDTEEELVQVHYYPPFLIYKVGLALPEY